MVKGILWKIPAAAAVLCLAESFTELKRLKLKSCEITDSRLPEELDGKKIAVISDLHCCRFGKKNARLFKLLGESGADLIILAGDLINGVKESETGYVREFFEELRKTGIKTVYAPGNHEGKLALRCPEAYGEFLDLAEKNSIYLDNSTFYCEEFGADIVGVTLPLKLFHGKPGGRAVPRTVNRAKNTRYRMPETCLWNRREPADGTVTSQKTEADRAAAARKAAEDGATVEKKYTIMVAHDPEQAEFYARTGAELCISGHLHGGIGRLPFVKGILSPRFRFFPKYSKGLYQVGSMKLFVSPGLGWHNIPVRFNNCPEIGLLCLKKG